MIRMARWARNPPSEKHVKLVLGLIAVLIIIALIEHYVGWPDILTADRLPRAPKY